MKLKTHALFIPVFFLFSVNCSFAEEISSHSSQLTGLGSGIWKKNNIPVCWENPNSTNENGRNLTRTSVKNTWEKNSLIRFTGWGACKENSDGIRILIEDDGPHVKKLGSHLDGLKNGMVLNFDFNNWSSSCKQSPNNISYCIKVIAIHEFGHALSFSHEQNRPDAPNECRKEMQGTTGDILITSYDINSVMNYCNPEWGGNGSLSKYDIQGLRDWYNDPIKLGIPTWRYSSAGASKWENINTSGVHTNNLRFGDFDGDGKDDIFTSNGGKWKVSYSGVSRWNNINYSSIGISKIRTGDFDGDGKEDIFISSGGKWKISYSGTTKWKDINGSDVNINNLRIGDFNGDGKDDIFTSSNGKWKISYSGTTKWKEVNSSSASINNLRFGDFDGDGKDDIFTSSGGKWKVSYSGTTKWKDINGSDVSINNIRVGDFNGDGKDDIFTSSGGKWKVSYSGTTKWKEINSSSANIGTLRFSDLDGDKKTDIFMSTK